MRKFFPYTSLALALCLSAAPSFGQAQSGPVDTSRDARAQGPTADQQKENKQDRELTKKIRKAVNDDSSLTTAAKQVKVVTVNGQVTLRGAVRSESEKDAIAAKAAAVAGDASKVDNQIMVSADQSSDADANKKTSKTKN